MKHIFTKTKNWINEKQRLSIIIIIVLLLIIFFVQEEIDKKTEKKDITRSTSFETTPSVEYLGAYLGSVVLGGFKPLIVDYLWIKAGKLKENRQYEEIHTLLELIARLQPSFISVWTFNSSIMAYDISRSRNSKEEQWNWVAAGINYLKKGLVYNPTHRNRTDLMERMGLIYFNRIPQDRYLMDTLEKITSKDCYTHAANWYQKMVNELKEMKKAPYQIEPWEAMTAGARFWHLFELARKYKFDEMLKKVDELISFANSTIKNYNVEPHLWERRIRGYQALKPAFSLEKKLVQYNPKTNPEEFFNLLPKVLDRYKQVIETPDSLIDNVPIRNRLEELLLVYFSEVYQAIDKKQFDKARMWWQRMTQLNQKLTPKDPGHISAFFFYRLKDRLNDMVVILDMEQSIDKAAKSKDSAAFISLLKKTIEQYQEYISIYRSLFVMPLEHKRLKQLKKIWREYK